MSKLAGPLAIPLSSRPDDVPVAAMGSGGVPVGAVTAGGDPVTAGGDFVTAT